MKPVVWLVLALMPMTLEAATATYHWQDNSPDETGFRIERKVGAGTYTTVHQAAANTTTYADPQAVTPGTTYCYRAFAVKGTLESAAGAEACCVPPNPPAAPTGGKIRWMTP